MAGASETRSWIDWSKTRRATARTWRSSSEPRTHRLLCQPASRSFRRSDVELTVTESSRRGAPMTLVRGGEDRDLDAIAAMGQARADHFRFHLDRNADLIKHAITRKRLLAGLGAAGVRQVEFVIAEEGITAAAYVVISVVGGTWTIEECGDRDASGARVGALLQALIAREPAESRPVIRGWLPPGFLPPQVTIASSSASPPVLLSPCSLVARPGLAPDSTRSHLLAKRPRVMREPPRLLLKTTGAGAGAIEGREPCSRGSWRTAARAWALRRQARTGGRSTTPRRRTRGERRCRG